jgi:hypothetical protein
MLTSAAHILEFVWGYKNSLTLFVGLWIDIISSMI